MSNFVNQSTLLDSKPVIYNVCNYTKPPAGEPALLSWDDVITMFHEFGHTLHGLFATQRYPGLSGTKPRAISSNFRRRLMSTGPASRRCSVTTPVTIRPGRRCRMRCMRRSSAPLSSTKAMR